jgi:hypothetical protein
MQVYRLDPVADHIDDARWAATELKETCWVLARSEYDARWRVSFATASMVPRTPGADTPFSPWLDPELSHCAPDSPALNVPQGKVVSIGRAYSVKDGND